MLVPAHDFRSTGRVRPPPQQFRPILTRPRIVPLPFENLELISEGGQVRPEGLEPVLSLELLRLNELVGGAVGVVVDGAREGVQGGLQLADGCGRGGGGTVGECGEVVAHEVRLFEGRVEERSGLRVDSEYGADGG